LQVRQLPSSSSCICADYVLEGEELRVRRGACVEFNDEGLVAGVGSSRSPGSPCTSIPGYLMPPLCNAHMHALDYAIAEAGEDRELEQLVALPYGLKYKLIGGMSLEMLEAAVKTLAARLEDDGTLYAGVYVEEGYAGASIVKSATSLSPLKLRLLLQPTSKSYPSYLEALAGYGGVGLDTAFDLDQGDLVKLAGYARSMGLQVHVHVAETRQLREMKDFELILEAKPTAAVHATSLSPDELLELALNGVGVVFCPRSNMLHTATLPPLQQLARLLDYGGLAALGTDNAAWLSPSMAEELSFSYIAYRAKALDEGFTVEEFAWSLLYSGTVACMKLLGLPAQTVDVGADTLLAVSTPDARYTSNPLATLVKRMASAARILVSGAPHQLG
jgi:cytosine/adenosine deaminase-related metal-dependent hydrolase